MGSGCGAVGRAVTFDNRGPGFDSSHRQLLLNIYLLLTVCRIDENKEKRPGMAHLLKKTIIDLKRSSKSILLAASYQTIQYVICV